MVQEKLAKQALYHTKLRDNSVFSNKILCPECGGFYGHKVWHNYANTERYDVWYCNHKYSKTKRCQSTVVRESQIKAAFEYLLTQLGRTATTFTEERWQELVESVTIHPNLHFQFRLTDGTEIEVALSD